MASTDNGPPGTQDFTFTLLAENVGTMGMAAVNTNLNLITGTTDDLAPDHGTVIDGNLSGYDGIAAVDTNLSIGTGTTNDQGSPSASARHDPFHGMNDEYNTIKSYYARLLSLAKQSQSPLSLELKNIGLQIYEFGRSLETGTGSQTSDLLDTHNVAKRLEGSNGTPPSPTNACMYNIPADCALGRCEHGKEQALTTELHPFETHPKDTIGLICDKYVAASELAGDQSIKFPSAGKRKVCNNKLCATRRHSPPIKLNAKRVCQWIKNAPDTPLSTVWVHLEGPPDTILTGLDIRRFLYPSMLTIKMADAIIWMLRSLENETLAKRTKLSGRHYVSPQWGINVENGNSCLQSSYEMFMSPTPPYNIERCTIVLTLVCFGDVWSCYAFDIARNTISVMDPNARHPVPEERVLRHWNACKKILPHLLYCMRKATDNKTLGRGGWTPVMLLAHGKSTSVQNSGIQALNCMRWYNGDAVCVPPLDTDAPQSRRDLVYQLLAMEDNIAATDVIAESMNEEGTSQSRKRARNEAEAEAYAGACNTTSSGSTN